MVNVLPVPGQFYYLNNIKNDVPEDYFAALFYISD